MSEPAQHFNRQLRRVVRQEAGRVTPTVERFLVAGVKPLKLEALSSDLVLEEGDDDFEATSAVRQQAKDGDVVLVVREASGEEDSRGTVAVALAVERSAEQSKAEQDQVRKEVHDLASEAGQQAGAEAGAQAAHEEAETGGGASPSAADKNFVYEPPTASTLWQFTHGLGKIPCLQCFDVNGEKIEPDQVTLTTTTGTAKFIAATAGKAVLN